MEDFKNIDLDNNLTFEPRLQEYLKKMAYYKKNNIQPSSNLDREFNITREDKLRIKAFLSGKKDIYSIESRDKYAVNEDTGFAIKYDDYKKDPRYERLQKKLQRDKDAINNRYSYGQGGEITGYNRCPQTNFMTDEEYAKNEESNHFLDSKPYVSDYYLNVRSNRNQRTYELFPPEIQYKQRLHYSQERDARNELPHNPKVDELIGKLDSYRDHTNTIYQYSADMDIENKIAIPNVNSRNKKYVNTSQYQAVPLRGSGVNLIGGTRDVDIENCLMKGLPERDAKFKSLGYPNYSDHSFQFISGDIQDPNHVVLPFSRGGINSRNENNFKRAKPYYREIY
jgi:hypothetical protein